MRVLNEPLVSFFHGEGGVLMEENKMGSMEIEKLMVSMSLLIMISMLVQALYNIVDSMFAARVSQEALTAVSLCYPVQMILVAVACVGGVGINSLLARRLGKKEYDYANRVAIQGIVISTANGVIFAILGLFFLKRFYETVKYFV